MPLVDHLGWERIPATDPVRRHYDVIICVKRKFGSVPHPPNVRQMCDRLIVDPLDYYVSPAKVPPYKAWRELWKRLQFDDILATSPACWISMQTAIADLGRRAEAHLVPHAADHRVAADWYDPDGPIVYCGGLVYIRRYQATIEQACKLAGKRFTFNNTHHAWRGLKGASLSLCLRLPPHDTEFNRTCKPQIKLENAAAAGLPALCSGHPCELSLRPHATVATNLDADDPARLAERIKAALAAGPLTSPVTLQDYLDRMREIVCGARVD